MRNSFRILTVLFATEFIVLISPNLYAQVNIAINHMSMYDDNSFAIHDNRADVYHQTFLALSKDAESDYSFLQVYYYGAMVNFRTFGTRNYHQHVLGAYYSIQLDHRENNEDDALAKNNGDDIESDIEDDTESEDISEDESVSIIGGVIDEDEESGEEGESQITRNAHESVTAISDSLSDESFTNSLSVIETTEELFSDSLVTYLVIKPSLEGRFDRVEYNFYDFKKGCLSLLIRKYLFSTLMSRFLFEIDYKHYPHFQQFTHLEQNGMLSINMRPASSMEVFGSIGFGIKVYPKTIYDTTYEATGSGAGKGKGSVKPKNRIISKLATPSTNQLVMSAGIIKELGAGTSFSVAYLRRINPSNQARFIDSRNFAGVTEDDIFDDRYGYESNEVEIHLITQLYEKLRIITGIGFERKAYPRPATNLEGINLSGDPNRLDSRLGFTAQIMYPLIHTQSGIPIFSAGVTYNFYRNKSNHAYNDYAVHQCAFVVEAGI